MQQSEFVLEIAHRVHYSNRNEIPIADVVASLLALERVLLRAPKILGLVTSVPIEKAEVFIEDIYTGSLTEDVILKLFFKNQDELDAFLTKIREELGKKKVTRNVLLGALILGIYILDTLAGRE